MRFSRKPRGSTSRLEGEHLTSSTVPKEWIYAEITSSQMARQADQGRVGSYNLPRRCPICYEQYRPEASDIQTNHNSISSDARDQTAEGWATLVHRRHSATSSISSYSESLQGSKNDEKGFRASRFVEQLPDISAAVEAEEVIQLDDLANNSAVFAQRRRRRCAQSCGTDSDNINFGLSVPKAIPVSEGDTSLQEHFYHLNGVRMRF